MHCENQLYYEAVEARLGAVRFHHSVCVAEAAVALAEKYGADPIKAERAGIIHDVMKEEQPDFQREVIARGGIRLSEVEKKAPKLLHAIAGAVYAELELGVDDREILDAIRYHTTGRADMTLLDEIIYLADYISAERSYNGVEVMRKAALRDLDEAVFTGLAYSIRELTQKGGAIHPDTMQAYNHLILSGKTQDKPPLL